MIKAQFWTRSPCSEHCGSVTKLFPFLLSWLLCKHNGGEAGQRSSTKEQGRRWKKSSQTIMGTGDDEAASLCVLYRAHFVSLTKSSLLMIHGIVVPLKCCSPAFMNPQLSVLTFFLPLLLCACVGQQPWRVRPYFECLGHDSCRGDCHCKLYRYLSIQWSLATIWFNSSPRCLIRLETWWFLTYPVFSTPLPCSL